MIPLKWWIPGIQFECNDCNRTGTIEMGNFSQYLGIECQRCYSINCEEQTSGARRSGADRTQGTTLTADDYALGAAAAQTALPQVELALAPGCSDMAAQHNSEFACTWCGPDTGRNEKKWCSLKCAADHNLAMAYPNDLSNYDLLLVRRILLAKAKRPLRHNAQGNIATGVALRQTTTNPCATS